jgi:hypothetical protein
MGLDSTAERAFPPKAMFIRKNLIAAKRPLT